MIGQQPQTSGLKQSSHITSIKDHTNCQEMVQHNLLMVECGTSATLKATISVMVQMNLIMIKLFNKNLS